jgi:hypothetical protein
MDRKNRKLFKNGKAKDTGRLEQEMHGTAVFIDAPSPG